MDMPHPVCGGQRETPGSQFPPPTMWVPGIELRSLALAAGILIYQLAGPPFLTVTCKKARVCDKACVAFGDVLTVGSHVKSTGSGWAGG